METVKLTLLAAAMGCETAVEADISHICTDTRKLTPGCLFVALKGETFPPEAGEGEHWPRSIRVH